MEKTISADLEHYDKLLNIFYTKLLNLRNGIESVFEPKEKETIRKAQRAWLNFRDAEKGFLFNSGLNDAAEYYLYLIVSRTKTIAMAYDQIKYDYMNEMEKEDQELYDQL